MDYSTCKQGSKHVFGKRAPPANQYVLKQKFGGEKDKDSNKNIKPDAAERVASVV